MNTALIVFIIFCLLILRPLFRIGWPVVKMIWRVRKAMKQGPAAASQGYGRTTAAYGQSSAQEYAASPKPSAQPRPKRHDYIDFEEIK